MDDIDLSILDEKSKFKIIRIVLLTIIVLFLIVITKGIMLVALFGLLPLYFRLFPARKNEKKYREFARKNKLIFSKRINKKLSPPYLLNKSKRRSIEFVIKGERDYPFCLFPYTYHLNFDGSDSATRTHWIMLVELEHKLPTFIVNAHLNDLNINNKSFIKISAEGDFSEFFDILARPNEHIDCLSVLTPEVLYSFRDFWATTDMIVEGSKVWFISTGQTDQNDIQELLDVASVIIPELQHRSRTYRRSA